jgi:hypothetical protein
MPSDTTTKTPNRSNKQSSFTSEKGPIYHGGKPTNYILSQNIPNRFQQQQQLHVETMMGLDRSNPIYSGTAKYFTGDGRVIRSTSSDSSDSSVQYEHFDRKKKHGNITTTTNKVDDDSVTTITSDSDIRTVATNATPLSSGSDFDIRSVAAMLSMSTKHQHSPSIPNRKTDTTVLSQSSKPCQNKVVQNHGGLPEGGPPTEGVKGASTPHCDQDAKVGLSAFWNRWKRLEL